MLRQRRLEALARPSRGCLVLYDDLDGASSGSTTASTAVAATGGGRKDNRSRRQKRVAVVVAEPPSSKAGLAGGAAAIDTSASTDPMLAMLVAAAAAVPGGGGEGGDGGGAAAATYVVRDLESGLSVELLGACLRRVRAAELPKGTVRPDYMPPASLGPPVTPLSAAAGVLVSGGEGFARALPWRVGWNHWRRGGA